MTEREYSVTVPVEVRVTHHDDGTTTVQFIDIDDEQDTLVWDTEAAERPSPDEVGVLIEAAEAAIEAAVGMTEQADAGWNQ